MRKYMDKNEDSLVNLISLLSRFFDLIHQPITIIDKDARFVYYNQESADIDGYSVQSALGKTHMEVYGIPKDHSSMLQALYDGKEFIGNYQTYYNQKGKAVEFQHTTVPIYSHEGTIQGVIEIGRNLSDTRILQDQVVELNNLLYHEGDVEFNQKYEILTADSVMQKLIEHARRLAISNMPIMIVGETGTGKELFARLIHNTSERNNKPFLALNCSAIPEPLIESTLFGTERGAFTGAENRSGYIDLAKGGTLFLDELNAMPASLQSKLLRFCQDQTFWKVGGSHQKTSDVRIISALNEQPSELIKSGRLRADLYYRLCIGQLVIPPLRTRPNDIILLSNHFIKKHKNIIPFNITKVSNANEKILKNLSWPGNVRMLENVIVRSMLSQDHDGLLDIIAYDEEISSPTSFSKPELIKEYNTIDFKKPMGLGDTLKKFEKQIIIDTLNSTNGNVSIAADVLQIPRATLYYKIKKYNLTFSVKE